jgi:hypothetical protein
MMSPMMIRRVVATLATGCLGMAVLGTIGCSRDPERSATAYCEQVKKVEGLDAILATGDVQRINEQVTELRLLQQVAPPEVEPSIATVLSVTEDLARSVGTARQPDAGADEVFTRRQSELPAIEAAGQTIERFTYDNCRLTLNGTRVPGSGVPGTGAPGAGTSTPNAGGQPTTTSRGGASPVTSTTLPKH